MSKNADEIDSVAREELEDRMVRHGLTDIPISRLNKEKAVNDLLVAEVVVTRTLALESFYKGLNCLGLGDLMRKYPVLTSVVFPSLAEAVVDPDVILQKLNDIKNENKVTLSGEKEELAWQWLKQFIETEGCSVGKSFRC